MTRFKSARTLAGASCCAVDQLLALLEETVLGRLTVWLYATLLTIGYMISRGLAKSGSRDPYGADDDR